MMRLRKWIPICGLPLLIAVAGAGNEYTLFWYSIDGGGGATGGDTPNGPVKLVSVIGQPDAGVLTGGGYTLTGGFLPLPVGVVIPADCDSDGDADLADYSAFQTCFTGSNESPDFPGLQPGCECFDLDGDADADLIDAIIFQASFTG
jgi:hypothetical protein